MTVVALHVREEDSSCAFVKPNATAATARSLKRCILVVGLFLG